MNSAEFVLMQSRPMTLALVTRRYPPLIGGAEKVLSYLAKAFANEGIDVTVITSQIPGVKGMEHDEVESDRSQTSQTVARDNPGRLSIVRLKTSRLRFHGTWLYMRNLKRWFQANPVDLAYVSMLKHDAHVVVRAGKRQGFPVVLRPEGAGATGDVAWQSRGNFGRTIGLSCRQASAFVSISNSVQEEVRRSLDSGTMRPARLMEKTDHDRVIPRIVSIPNGVFLPEPSWQVRREWQAAPRAIFVGRLAPEKGLDSLIAAWARVRLRFPTAQLVVIGEGPERAALERLAAMVGLTLGPGQAIDLPGSLPCPTDALRNADLFVLPSREEGMSMALLEAMALGMPIVASSILGNQRLVTDFEHGRLAPPDDPICLARTIVEQWENFDGAVQMGLAARSRVQREFSIEVVAREHLALFRELIAVH